jgi:hypothetical protein
MIKVGLPSGTACSRKMQVTCKNGVSMKTIIAVLSATLTFNVFALNGLHLSIAGQSAFEQAEVEMELDHIEAWQATLKEEEVEVNIKSHDSLLTYGCHLHGSEMACHEEGDHHLMNKELPFFDMQTAYQTAMQKFSDTLARRGHDLSIMESVKVWKLEDHDHESADDHEHGTDVWTKVTYELNGVDKTTFIQCHRHPGEEKFACHYKREGQGEPTLDGGHDDHDDHDHDHGDDHDHNH